MRKIIIGIIVLCLLAGCSKVDTNEPAAHIIDESSDEKIEIVENESISSEKEEIVEEDIIGIFDRSHRFESNFNVECSNLEYSQHQNYEYNEFELNNCNSQSRLDYFTYQVEMIQGYTYIISFELSSNVFNKAALVIKDWNQEYYRNWINCDEDQKYYSISYTHQSDYLIDDIISLEFYDENSVDSGMLAINNFRIECTNATRDNVAVDQYGYNVGSKKIAVFNYNVGDVFYILNNQNQIVYKGYLEDKIVNKDTGEINLLGDFSDFDEEGVYTIKTQINGASSLFTIGRVDYKPLLQSALNVLTVQRCGIDFPKEVMGDFAHNACHKNESIVYGSERRVDLSGGWHDAGDYGRYTITQVKTINDCLFAALLYPEAFSDSMGLLDSHNEVTDILDEAKIGLDWLMKINTGWGSVYNSVVTEEFAGFINPDEDNAQTYALEEENTATAASAGALALGAILFESVNSSLAADYLNQAKIYYNYAINSGFEDKKNPNDISAGDYGNGSDKDEKFFAASALYCATKEDCYLDVIEDYIKKEESFTEFTYNDFSGYGTYLLLNNNQFRVHYLYNVLYNRFVSAASSIVNAQNQDGYQVAVYAYTWGGNMYVANYGNLCLMAYQLTGNEKYKDAARNQLSYLLGRNSLHQSFISGYGLQYPQHIHQRMAIKNNLVLKGALVGGPDDSLTYTNVASAKKYYDDYNVYETNEIAIYYNSSLIFLVAGLIE